MTPKIFAQFITLGTESNLEGSVWSHPCKTGQVSLRQFALQYAKVFGKYTFQMLFFQNTATNLIISKIYSL